MKIARIAELVEKIDAAYEELRELQVQAQETADQRSDKWRDSEKGQEEEDKIQTFESALDDLENALCDLKDFAENNRK